MLREDVEKYKTTLRKYRKELSLNEEGKKKIKPKIHTGKLKNIFQKSFWSFMMILLVWFLGYTFYFFILNSPLDIEGS